ncbi:MAG: response regulator [Methanobacterium sp.]|uniref:response regulator n=1 Tax=Methanobacterium sp. TaxID=2164 RepID=UPI003C753BF4
MTPRSKIIIVEDEIIIALDLKLRLENLGYEVIYTAFNGEDAIKRTGETNPDLVLMDIQLNGEMDGINVAQQIRSLYNIPFIYLTGSYENSLLERAKQTDPVGFINKPFDESEIQSLIENAMSQKQDFNSLDL